ncbi:hypothetical protein BDQ17DRAFT_1326453 [Cyathus striatus]|nr:hypothetical protein BDQ17DRAFT_1326453 [Cyathus striatus]
MCHQYFKQLMLMHALFADCYWSFSILSHSPTFLNIAFNVFTKLSLITLVAGAYAVIGHSNGLILEMLGVGLWLGKGIGKERAMDVDPDIEKGMGQLPREEEEEEEEAEAEAETLLSNMLMVASSPHDHPPIHIEELPVSGDGDVEMDKLDIWLMHSMHEHGEERPISASFDGGEIVGAHEGQDECPPSPDVVVRSPSPHGPLASASPILFQKSSDMPREATSLSLSIQLSSPLAPLSNVPQEVSILQDTSSSSPSSLLQSASTPEVKLTPKDFALQKKKWEEEITREAKVGLVEQSIAIDPSPLPSNTPPSVPVSTRLLYSSAPNTNSNMAKLSPISPLYPEAQRLLQPSPASGMVELVPSLSHGGRKELLRHY